MTQRSRCSTHARHAQEVEPKAKTDWMRATAETVCLLSKLHEAKHHVNVTLDMDELDIQSAKE